MKTTKNMFLKEVFWMVAQAGLLQKLVLRQIIINIESLKT